MIKSKSDWLSDHGYPALHESSLIAKCIRKQAKKLVYGTSLSVISEHSFEKIKAAIRDLQSQRVEFIIMSIPLRKEEAEMLVAQYSGIHFFLLMPRKMLR